MIENNMLNTKRLRVFTTLSCENEANIPSKLVPRDFTKEKTRGFESKFNFDSFQPTQSISLMKEIQVK